MPLYLYIDRRTAVHRLHPVVKLAGMVGFFVAAFVCDHPLAQLPLLLGVGAALAATGSLANVRRLRVLFTMVFAMTFLVWALFGGRGKPWVQVGYVSLSRESLLYALGMALKLTDFLAVGTLFLSTTKVEEFAYALTRVGVPYKLGFTMTLAFRLVPAFVDAAFAVVQAQRCRGFDFDAGGFWRRVQRYVPVVVPVFLGALRRADYMAMALEARGFQLRTRRTFYQRFGLALPDAAGLVVIAAITSAYLWLWWKGYGRAA